MSIHEQLNDEIISLQETAEILIGHVEDVAASIRYMTNNLLDDTYHPDMANSVRQLAERVNRLVTLSPHSKADEALPQLAQEVVEVSTQLEKLDGTLPANRNDSREEGTVASYNESPECDWTVIANKDGQVSIYSADGDHLATEPTTVAAIRTAEFAEADRSWPDDVFSPREDFDAWVASMEGELIESEQENNGKELLETKNPNAGTQRLADDEESSSVEPGSNLPPQNSKGAHKRPTDAEEPSSDEPGSKNRQDNFGGLPAYEWPEPEHDRHTMTVDRVSDRNPENPNEQYRFTIRRGDTVEVFFSKDKTELGTVVGISHANEEVRVQFREGTQGTWFYKGKIYPTPEADTKGTVPLSEIVANAEKAPPYGWKTEDAVEQAPVVSESQESQAKGMDSFPLPVDTVNHRPYTLKNFEAFQKCLDNQDITAEELKEQFQQLVDSQESIIERLVKDNNAKQLKAMAQRCGCFHANRQTKPENAKAILNNAMQRFNLHRSVRYSPFDGETFQDALTQMVLSITEEELQDFYQENEKRIAAQIKALENPETLGEFGIFLQMHRREEMTDQQLALWDQLHADSSRARRKDRKTSTTVTQITSEGIEDLEFAVKEGFHDKQKIPLWIVQLSTRVDRQAFQELKQKAKMLGGWYSSFKKSDAGFQFKEQQSADKFTGLLSGDADRTDELAARKISKMDNAAERFVAMADKMLEEAQATLEADDTKLKNTARRAEQAASIRAGAYLQQATANTLRSVADDLASGKAQYLDGIRMGTHIQELKRIASQAKTEHVRHLMAEHEEVENPYSLYRIREKLDAKPIEQSDIAFAKYPYPRLHLDNLKRAFNTLDQKPGLIKVTAKMRKFAKHARESNGMILFTHEYDIQLLNDFLSRAKADGYDDYWFEHCTESYKRLQAANIYNEHELRAALRELLPHLSQRQADDPVKRAEDDLRGKDLPGFFPTPRPVIEKMLGAIDIKSGDKVLEPSCGKGDILDALKNRYSDIELHAIEQNRTLAGVLEAKGHKIEWGDFLEHEETYNAILMNPPFEKGHDALHVQKAYELLKENGQLVAIMCKGPFLRSDAKSKAFREWLDELDHDLEELPEDAFQGVGAFKATGVRTALVSIHK